MYAPVDLTLILIIKITRKFIIIIRHFRTVGHIHINLLIRTNHIKNNTISVFY